MKNCIAILIMLLTTWSLSAQSVWTGNAAAGGISDFPVASDVFQAASNTFPAGTVLRVTNPRGSGSVDVRVIGRLESPGVFILIEERAAAAIGLPLDQVMPVRVSPVVSGAEPDSSPGILETATPAPELTSAESTGSSAAIDSGDSAVDEEITGEPQTIIAYDLAVEETDTGETVTDSAPVPDTLASDEDDFGVEPGSGKIFFLMPADLRPPEAASVPVVEEAAPLPPLPAASSFDIYQVMPGDKRAFVQIGAYRNRSVMEDAARWIATYAPGYPVSMAVVTGSSGEVYKLLLGPLKPAERGVVLRTARTTVFPDAFPYRP